jgi:hypothetical protein
MKQKCEAIRVFGKKSGEQCAQLATEQAGGRCVCWTHARAFSNPERLKPLRFVAAIPWQQSA